LYLTTLNERLERLCFCGLFCWVTRRRGLVNSVLAALALAAALLLNRGPLHFFSGGLSTLEAVCLALALAGASVRLWGAGNLRKNKEVTRTGVYRMVRHPLYLGNCLIYLAFLLAVAGPLVGGILFFVLVFGVHYPAMLQEEARLAREYPGQLGASERTPRLLPNLLALPQALATDRFSFRQALRNRGLSGFLGVVFLPVCTEVLIRLRDVL
jgi:protein-S-isoprenylcysteine O-methyltransferase Ste14